MMNILFKGFIYGLFSIIPGLSGGALALHYGDYSKCIQIINDKDFSFDNVKYLLLILIGFIIGSSLCSRLVFKLYISFISLFKILIFTINMFLLSKLSVKEDKKMLVIIVLSTIIIFFLLYNTNLSFKLDNILLYSLCGIIFSFSKVVPGFSSTSILINLSFYDKLLLFFSNPFKELLCNFPLWTLFIIVAVFSSLVFVKLIVNYKMLFNRFVIILLIINTLDLII